MQTNLSEIIESCIYSQSWELLTWYTLDEFGQESVEYNSSIFLHNIMGFKKEYKLNDYFIFYTFTRKLCRSCNYTRFYSQDGRKDKIIIEYIYNAISVFDILCKLFSNYHKHSLFRFLKIDDSRFNPQMENKFILHRPMFRMLRNQYVYIDTTKFLNGGYSTSYNLRNNFMSKYCDLFNSTNDIITHPKWFNINSRGFLRNGYQDIRSIYERYRYVVRSLVANSKSIAACSSWTTRTL